MGPHRGADEAETAYRHQPGGGFGHGRDVAATGARHIVDERADIVECHAADGKKLKRDKIVEITQGQQPQPLPISKRN